MAFQNDIYESTRDHRTHHKFTETDADPHNAKKGFFFAHMGWLMCRKHPDVIEKGKTIDMSDLLADPVIRFQRNKMAPHSQQISSAAVTETSPCSPTQPTPAKAQFKAKIVWRNVIIFIYLHIAALYGFKLFLFDAKWVSWIWCWVLYLTGGMGVTAGAHRLWCHRSYSATLPLRIYLCLCNCIGFQNDIYEWTRDHRAHHKFSETDADPHNAKRGFFFAHMGWLMCKKHPDVIEKGKCIDLSDLTADPVVVFQKKYYLWLVAFMCFFFPAAVAHYGWQETWWNGFFVCAVFRYVAFLHCAWFVNSAAHLWGDKPYDKGINPAESMLAIISSSGEGFHNYHHTFPWDYQASEWGWRLNLCTAFIDVWAALGLAYNLKKVPQEVVNRRRELKGDGSKVWYPEIIHQREKSH